jgi:hypothetical protein
MTTREYTAIDALGRERELREGELLGDGERLVVRMTMMDGVPRPLVTDAYGGAAGLSRPGIRVSARDGDPATGAAYDDYEAYVRAAWRQPQERPRRRPEHSSRTGDSAGRPDTGRTDAAYARRDAWLADAWRSARPESYRGGAT